MKALDMVNNMINNLNNPSYRMMDRDSLLMSLSLIKGKLESSFTYEYQRMQNVVDIICIYRDEVLLIRRGHEPYKGMLALPGGFMEMGETGIQAAIRELREETGIHTPDFKPFPHRLGVYDEVNRDPRDRTISQCFMLDFYNTMDNKVGRKPIPKAGDDAAEAAWYNLDYIMTSEKLAFDHMEMLEDATYHLKGGCHDVLVHR